MSSSKQRKLGAILSYTNILLATLLGIIYTPFLLKTLGQSEYGLYSLILALMSFLAILDLGFGNSIVRFHSKLRVIKDEKGITQLNGLFVILYSAMGIIALIIGFIIYINFEVFIGNSLSNDEVSKAKIMFIILILNLAFTLFMSIYNSLLVAYERFIIVQCLNIFKTLTLPIVMIPLLLLGYKSIALVFVTVLLNIIALLIAAYICYTSIRVKISFQGIQFGLFKDISTYSFFILLNILVDKLYAPTSQYILGLTAGTTAVAIFAIGIQFSSYFVTLSTSLNSVFLPRITQLVVQDNKKEISEIFIKIGRIQFIILVFVLSGFFIFGKEFIILWAGPEYINSYYIALIIMVPAIIPLSQNIGLVILQARNQLKFRVLIYLVLAIINVFLSFYLSQYLEEIGPAISVLIANLIGQIFIMNYYYYKFVFIDIPNYWREISKIFLVILAPTIIIISINNIIEIQFDWLKLISYIVLYSIVLFLIGVKFIFNKYEISLLVTILSKFRRLKE